MSKIHETYSDLVGTLAKDYRNTTPAAAIFYWDNLHRHGLRIEAVELMVEFVNNVSFGRDPEGLLFYHNPDDFDDDMDSNYNVYYNSEKNKAIKIDFYPPGGSKPFATFLARDEQGLKIDVLANGSGKWGILRTGTSAATIHKIGNNSTVEIKLYPIGKKVSFPAPGSRATIKGNGVFYYPELNHFKDSDCVVSYNADRIVFYSRKDTSKHLAVFFPSIGTELKIDNDSEPHPAAIWADL